MTYTNICPANDWFFRHAAPNEHNSAVIYQVAVWATKEDGHVIGLIAPCVNDDKHSLMAPPPVPGFYLHRDQLDDDELKLIKKR